MPLFSVFQDFVAFNFSNRPTRGEDTYRAMIAAESKAFNTTVGEYEESRIYATAMGIARARYALERGFHQRNPNKAIEMLPELEKDWMVVPGAHAGVLERQQMVAARMQLPRGSRRENVVAQLTAIYGTDFVEYRTIDPLEVFTWPHSPFDGPGIFAREDGSFVPKYLKTVDPVGVLLQTINIRYEALQLGDETDLAAGDYICIQPENLGLAERLTVQAVGEDSFGRFFTATFTKSHDIGASIITGTVPIWFSTQRIVLIVVKAAAVADVEKRRLVSEVMQKVSRVVTQWAIVQPTTPGATTIGPFTLNVSPVGAAPVEQLAIIP